MGLQQAETEGPAHEEQRQHPYRQVSIRAATPSDGEALHAMFSRSSSETIYKRFLMSYPKVPEWMVALMLEVDHQDNESLVTVAREGIIVGHAMYTRLGEGTEAEMSLVVEDGWQSKGVGTSLLFELEQRARLRGIETFNAQVLATNCPMLGLAAAFAGTAHTMANGVYYIRMPLRMASGVRGPGSSPRHLSSRRRIELRRTPLPRAPVDRGKGHPFGGYACSCPRAMLRL